MRLAILCDACEAGDHHECDGMRWDVEGDDWAQCDCRDTYHD